MGAARVRTQAVGKALVEGRRGAQEALQGAAVQDLRAAVRGVRAEQRAEHELAGMLLDGAVWADRAQILNPVVYEGVDGRRCDQAARDVCSCEASALRACQ